MFIKLSIDYPVEGHLCESASRIYCYSRRVAMIGSLSVEPVRRLRIAVMLSVTMLSASNVRASTEPPRDPDSPDVSDHYRVFASDTLAYDDNIFRLPLAFPNLFSSLSPNSSRQDRIDTVSIGTDDKLYIGRQVVALQVEFDENYFKHNRFLDDTSGNGSVLWAWQIASAFSGHIGTDYSRQLANSSQTLFYGKDLVSSINEFADARYDLGTKWDLFGGFHAIDTTNSAVEVQANNFHSKSGNAGIDYLLVAEDTIGIEYLYTDARAFQNVEVLGFLSNNYNEDRVRLTGKYSLDDKTRFDANVGYLKRYYPNTEVGRFSGDVWRVDVSWQPTDRVGAAVAEWRDLQAYLDAESNYFIANGESISPTWAASEKVSIGASIVWVSQRFIASNASFYTPGLRRDEVSTQQVNIVYTPFESVLLSLAYSHEAHRSTVAVFAYDDRIWRGTIKFSF